MESSQHLNTNLQQVWHQIMQYRMNSSPFTILMEENESTFNKPQPQQNSISCSINKNINTFYHEIDICDKKGSLRFFVTVT